MKKSIILLAAFLIGSVVMAQEPAPQATECYTVYSITNVALTPNVPTAGNGRFSVSDSKIVRFSPGNLRYAGCPTSGHFYFAPNQWEYLAHTYCNCNTGNADTDLFGYGTSGYQVDLAQDNPPTVCWGDDFDDVANRMAPVDIAGTHFDWGVHNAIKFGTSTYNPEEWRTLTLAEWQYLVYHRPNADKLYSAAVVNGNLGLIILPDDWVLPAGSQFTTGLSFNHLGASRAPQNTYTGQAWTVMENAGAVFLPAAGCIGKVGNDYQHIADYCCYITATQGADVNTMYRMDFGYEDITPRIQTTTKNTRSSVRLVQDWK